MAADTIYAYYSSKSNHNAAKVIVLWIQDQIHYVSQCGTNKRCILHSCDQQFTFTKLAINKSQSIRSYSVLV